VTGVDVGAVFAILEKAGNLSQDIPHLLHRGQAVEISSTHS